jgi:hypothetical protein
MLIVLVGEVSVTPGIGVTAPGVCRTDCVPRNKVGVTVASGGGGVVGAAHAVTRLVSRIDPMNKGKRVLVFMLISSFDYYIYRSEKKKNARGSLASGID